MRQKLSLFILFTTVSLGCVAQTIGETFYVYRNDGQFNAFLKADIESIEYSDEDANGITYNEIVTQIINTKDSIYKIPLAVIDSIAFVTPQTIINDDVFLLTEEHSQYISEADTLHFTMSFTTPEMNRPRVGNIVVSTADCSAFPDGIIAKVETIRSVETGYRYECSLASIDDVFEQLVVHANPLDEASTKDNIPAFDLRRVTIPETTLWDEDWSKTITGGGASATFGVGTRASITVTVRKTLKTPLYFQLQLQNTLESSVDFDANKYIGRYIREQIGKTITAGHIEIPNTFGILWISPKLSLYCYFQGEGNVDLKYHGHFNRSDKVVFTYSEGEWQFNHAPINDAGTDVASISLNGYAEIGLMPQIDFSLNGRKAGIGMSASVGLKEYGNFLLDLTKLSDGGLYEAMRDSYCRTTIPWSVTVHGSIDILRKYDSDEADIGSGTVSYTYEPEQELQWGDIRYLFPLFKDVKAVKTSGSNNKYIVNANIERTPLFPMQVGFSMLNEDKEIVNTLYDNRTLSSNNLFTSYNLTLTPADKNKKYSIRPSIKLFGYDILASPEASFSSFQISELKQISTTYKNEMVYAKIKAFIDISSDISADDLSTYKKYGVYIKNSQTGRESYISVQEIGNNEVEFTLSIPKNEFVVSDDSFTATCNSFSFAAYAVDKDGNLQKFNELEYPVIYDQAPSISFSSPSVESTTMEPRTDEYGNTIIYYTTICKWEWEDKGSFWVNSVVRKDSHGGQGDSFTPSDGTGTVHYRWTYPASSFSDKEIWYDIYLNNGQVLTSTNKILISGSYTNPSISIR